MSRKRAIEAALTSKSKDNGIFEDDVRVAEHAYDAGRIAGLREGARLLSTRCTGCTVEITQHARKLAKKARGK